MTELPPETDGELRRRAAWLLGMLVLVAVLLVVIFVVFFRGTNDQGSPRPLGSDPITNTAPPPTSSGSGTPSSSPPGSSSASDSGSSSSSPAPSSSRLATGSTSCPSSDPCALSGDAGNALPAINAMRAQDGKSAITGTVTDAARQCALHNGNGCPSGFAVTELGSADGAQAVKKISQFADFEASGLKTIQLGWAYDPGAKTYYFSTIQAK